MMRRDWLIWVFGLSGGSGCLGHVVHAPVAVESCFPRLKAFEPYLGRVEVDCVDGFLTIRSIGLPRLAPAEPRDRMMVGIESWILRVPIPYDYHWRVPLRPEWLPEFALASPKGPIAVAVDGVPIFHYEARPDASTHPDDYDPKSDTVVRGELDQCGGHAGQGEDYHYHYAPVCLLDEHDLSQPIAYGLDGTPIYFGTGGTDYYGGGRFNDLDNLPDAPLDLCNALELERGGYAHFTTAEPPYLIGCHHGYADPGLRIEPRPMRRQGSPGPYGGRVGEPSSTLITDWYVDAEGWMHLEHTSFDGRGTSAVIYRALEGEGDCWEFEFREDASEPGTLEVHCRPGLTEPRRGRQTRQ